MDHTQPDLLGGEHDPLAVAVPPSRPGGPSWEQVKPTRGVSCAHCMLVADRQRRDRTRIDEIRLAGWKRTGVRGCVLMLCAGHRRLQRQADQAAKIT